MRQISDGYFSCLQRLTATGTALRCFLRDVSELIRPLPIAVPQRQQTIVFFNWRDTKHAWAGGAELYLHEIAKRLVTKNTTVVLLCGNDSRQHTTEIVDGVYTVRHGGFFTVYLWCFLYYLRFFRSASLVIDAENGIPFFTPLYARRPVYLLIHHIHQDVFFGNLFLPLAVIGKFLESQAMPFVYRHSPIITVSASSKTDIVQLFQCPPERVTVVTPGVLQPRFKRVAKPSKTPTLLSVGRLRPYKNIGLALQAFKQVLPLFPAAHFTIVGSGEADDELQKLAKSLHIADHVTFTGHISEKRKQQLYQKNWLLLQPSLLEGWGMTVLEANSYGLPVVAALSKGLQDAVLHGKTGFLVSPRAKQFALAICLLLHDTNLRLAFGRNAKHWSEENSWEHAVAIFQQTIAAEAAVQPIGVPNGAPIL